MNRKSQLLLLFLSLVFLSLAVTSKRASADRAIGRPASDEKSSSDGLWHEIGGVSLLRYTPQREIMPVSYRTLRLNIDALTNVLRRAPMEFTAAARNVEIVMTLPMPDGDFGRFRIEESPIMESELAAQFPEIKTYSGQGIDDPTATLRFDVSSAGFHAQVISTRDTVYVDPYVRDDVGYYISYYKRDFRKEGAPFECLVDANPENGEGVDISKAQMTVPPNGDTLRNYRLALGVTGEYTIAAGGTIPLAMARMTTSLNRVNGIYRRELALSMTLVANNSLLIFADPATDPYTNSDGFAMMAQHQTTADTLIGSANYDMGHVFSTGGGGFARIRSTCNPTFKGQGVTGLPSPVGDPFDVDFVAHEMGHQHGGLHTFNTISGICAAPARTIISAFEPGSGSTPMSYVGTCSPSNLQKNANDYFHVRSLEEMVAHITVAGNCAPQAATGNTPPTVNAGPDFTIPRNTPFVLSAISSDANGDALTHCWEEYDLGPESPPEGDADGMARPIFRSYSPTVSGNRTFPTLGYILANANVPPATYDCSLPAFCLTGESLPNITRTMNFQVTARDNRASGGGIVSDTMAVAVSASAGPFNVTAPNTGLTWTGGTLETVTWSVAGTTAAPVSTANVKISLSRDGGLTFPTIILASTPNDGAQTITVPNSPSPMARIKVEAIGNIFFDISNTNFIIIPGIVVPQRAPLDFDGDNKTDLAVVRNSAGALNWYLLQSLSGFTGVAWGALSDMLVPGDYDGDQKWDIAVWRAGVFYIVRSSDAVIQTVIFGQAGDDPRITQDFDGDGIADPAVTRDVGGSLSWFLLRSATGFTGVSFGAGSDVSIRGDFDGDYRADIAVYRPSTGTYYVLRSSDGGVQAASFGVFSSDFVVPADFDGDAKTDYAVWRGFGVGAPGTWFWLRSSDGVLVGLNFGAGNLDFPVIGDYDGDGKTDQAVWRPGASGVFYLNRSTAGFTGIPFGTSGDLTPAYTLQAR